MTAVAATKTEAEDQLARQFKAIAHELPGGGWVPAARAGAMRRFEADGLPHRRIEAWKYTDLRQGLGVALPPASCSPRQIDDAQLEQALGPELARLPCIRLLLVNGRHVASVVPAGHEADGSCHFGSLAGVLGQPGYEWMERCFTADGDDVADPVLALNTAFATDGVVLRVVEGARLALPIHIVSIVDADAPKSIATRNLIKIDKGSQAIIIESHVALGQAPTQATAVTQLGLEAGATAHHIQHVAAGAASSHLGRWDIELGADAVYRGFQLTAGAGLLRNETHASFTGADARFELSGLMLGRDRDHIDTTLIVDHTTTGCESRELFKAVLDERARAVFQGKVVVAPEAQKTDGRQMAQALMLSEDVEFDSKPELEIYADDVACGHGATVAEIDPGMMFYLRSRGIPEDVARALLIESFATEALERIEPEDIREAARAITLGWLAAGQRAARNARTDQ